MFVVTALLVLTACSTSSTTSTSGAVDSTTGTVACGTRDAPPCVPIPSTRVLDDGCGDITSELVAKALGEPATLIAHDADGCQFGTASFTLGFETIVDDPWRTGITTADAVTPSQTFLTNDRSGSWWMRGQVSARGLTYLFTLVDRGRGSDTYPPVDGPPRRPVLRAAGDALVAAIEGSR